MIQSGEELVTDGQTDGQMDGQTDRRAVRLTSSIQQKNYPCRHNMKKLFFTWYAYFTQKS